MLNRLKEIWTSTSIRTKLFLSYSILVAGISVFIFLWFPAQLEEQATQAIREKSSSISRMIAFSVSPALVFDDPETASEAILSARQNEGIEYVVITRNEGEVFADFNLRAAEKIGYSETGNEDRINNSGSHYLVRTPIEHENAIIGYLYLGQSLKNLRAEIAAAQSLIALVAALVLLVGIIAVYSISNYLTRPLGQMVSIMDRIIQGDWSQRATVSSRDEVGKLADSFNTMVANLNVSTLQLRKSERRFRTLVETMNEALVQIDKNMEIVFVNNRFCKLFGFNADEVVGKEFWKVLRIDEKDAAPFRESLRSPSMDFGEHFEVEMRTREGRPLWALVSSAPELNDQGEWVRTSAIITDITDLKETENLLRFKNHELDTFVYKASHDLKAPLNSLQGLVRIASSEVEDPAAMQYINLISRTTTKLNDVLMGLLEVTMIKEGAVEINHIPARMMLDEILENLQHMQKYEEIEVTTEVPEKWMFPSDRHLLHSILQNLISNAIKYHRNHGEDRMVHISAEESDNGTRIVVKDNGPGIPKDLQEKVFEMFFRATKDSQGSGLGLYIVKNAVEKLGGTLTLESTSTGSVFSVFLPAREVE